MSSKTPADESLRYKSSNKTGAPEFDAAFGLHASKPSIAKKTSFDRRMYRQSSSARRHDGSNKFSVSHSSNNGSYLKQYQMALMKDEKVSSLHMNRWERSNTVNGRVRQQKLELDAKAHVSVYRGDAQTKKAKKHPAREIVPWPTYTIPEIVPIKVTPPDPLSPPCSSLSWGRIEFDDDSDSVLFSPSVADTASIVSDTDHLFPFSDAAPASGDEWCDGLPSLDQTQTKAPLTSTSQASLGIGGNRTIVKKDWHNDAAKTSQSKATLSIPDQPETDDITSLVRLRRRRLGKGGRQQEVELATSKSDSSDLQSTPPEFLLMKEKLKKVRNRSFGSENELPLANFPTQRLNRPTSERCEEAVDNSSATCDRLNPSSSFGNLSGNSTDITSPETFDSLDHGSNAGEEDDGHGGESNRIQASDVGIAKILSPLVSDSSNDPTKTTSMADTATEEKPVSTPGVSGPSLKDDPLYAK